MKNISISTILVLLKSISLKLSLGIENIPKFDAGKRKGFENTQRQLACTSAETITRRVLQTNANIHHRATNFRDKYFTGDHYELLTLPRAYAHIQAHIFQPNVVVSAGADNVQTVLAICTVKSDEFAVESVPSTKLEFILISKHDTYFRRKQFYLNIQQITLFYSDNKFSFCF